MVKDTKLFIYRQNNPNYRDNKISLGYKKSHGHKGSVDLNIMRVKVETSDQDEL